MAITVICAGACKTVYWTHNPMEFRKAVSDFLNEPSESSMSRIVDFVRRGCVDDSEIAYLASRLAQSGAILSWCGDRNCADVASTGGPSSLSTLLCPLFLRQAGSRVPKLGVPGRPAGGIDVLAQIPGYRVSFSAGEVERILQGCGYIHFVAEVDFAPRDGQLFAYRKQHNAVSLPELAIASLLSKKIAVGLSNVGLDIRVAPYGNFGETWERARANAFRFNRVASMLGLRSVCFLTDARVPYQPFIGRGESLLAIDDVLEGRAGEWLGQHLADCRAMATAVSGASREPTIGGTLKEIFESNLQAQGSSMSAFSRAVAAIRSATKQHIFATRTGRLEVDLGKVRDVIVMQQELDRSDSCMYPDPAGLILRCQVGEIVKEGDLVATVRCAEPIWERIRLEIQRAFSFSERRQSRQIFEVVTDA